MDSEIKKELKHIRKCLKQYNKLLESHMKRTQQIESWMMEHKGNHSGKFAAVREIGIITGICLVLARVFGLI